MRARGWKLAWYGGAIGLLASCALVGHRSKDDEEPERLPSVITLHVENQNFYDATVYALARSGQRQRLGQVIGNSDATFTFHWMHDELRVIIQLLAGRSTVTDEIPVDPGDTLNLVVQPNLHVRVPDDR